ncbi:flagellar hook-associated protein FlgK [Tabrizicola sp. WMC-M-20]|nr:flagellar hook-associated protein FlgK [Tabrizicola sp. WMC-M-20]
MGLSSSLSIASSGLRAQQSWADTTARNIANADTAGYVRKDTAFYTRGGSVEVSAIRREVDATLDRMDRSATSRLARQQTLADGVSAYTAILGQPDDETSPVTALNRFQLALFSLANTPGSPAVQRSALDSATALARTLNEASTRLADVGREVALGINYDITDLNETLYRVASLNQQISRAAPDSIGMAELQDEMGRLIDRVSGFADVRVTQGRDGTSNLFTSGGTELVIGQRVSDIRHDTATGTLFAGDIDITPGRAGTRGFDNGSLGGLFALKDQTLPAFQLQLDEMARVLVTGFAGADASIAAGTAGLFTDGGAAFDPVNLTGLAGRIEVNAAVDPAQGGTLTRMRDGVGTLIPGDAGDAAQVTAFLAVFDQPLTIAPGAGLGTGMTLQAYAVTMVTSQQTARTDAQAAQAAIAISAETIAASRQNLQGVNIDDELQKLLLIQQSYAANAKMMTAVTQMMDTLLAAV